MNISKGKVTPTFFGSQAIDKLFESLFSKRNKSLSATQAKPLSDLIIGMGGIQYSFHLNYRASAEQPQLCIRDGKTLNDITRLYYGLRCVYAHGGAKSTLDGALKDFPSQSELESNLAVRPIAERLCGLYQRIKDKGRDTYIHYLTLVNLQRFLMILALRLCRAISCAIHIMFGKSIWGYDPTRNKSDLQSEELNLTELFREDADTDVDEA